MTTVAVTGLAVGFALGIYATLAGQRMAAKLSRKLRRLAGPKAVARTRRTK